MPQTNWIRRDNNTGEEVHMYNNYNLHMYRLCALDKLFHNVAGHLPTNSLQFFYDMFELIIL